MTKTIQLDPDIHSLVVNARMKLYNSGIDISMTDIVGTVIRDNIEEFVTKSEDVITEIRKKYNYNKIRLIEESKINNTEQKIVLTSVKAEDVRAKSE